MVINKHISPNNCLILMVWYAKYFPFNIIIIHVSVVHSMHIAILLFQYLTLVDSCLSGMRSSFIKP